MDIEFADPILPSICVISLIYWENNKILDCEYVLMNPDCEISLPLKSKRNISEAFFLKAPYFHEVWSKIAEKIKGQTVFCFHANRTITALKNRALIDNLFFPDLTFFCTHSLANRTKDIFQYETLSVPYLKKRLNINPSPIISDAMVSGILLEKTALHFDIPYEDLFSHIGYAGGAVRNETKILYRSFKSSNGEYMARFFDKEGNPIEISL